MCIKCVFNVYTYASIKYIRNTNNFFTSISIFKIQITLHFQKVSVIKVDFPGYTHV